MNKERLFSALSGQKNNFTIRPTLLIIFTFLVIVPSGIIGYFSFNSGRKAAINLASRIQDSIQYTISQDLNNFLSTSHALNKINAEFIKSNPVNSRDLASLRMRFLYQIKSFESVMACAFGSEAGDFSSAGRRSEGSFDCAIADKTKDNDYRVYLMDEQGQPTELVKVVKDYHPHPRPWYQAALRADGPAWSPIYIWASQTNIGLSAVLPVYDSSGSLAGVQMSALSLGYISHFLQKLERYYSEQIFIIDRSGLLVATSGSDPLIRKSKSETGTRFERIPAKSSTNHMIRASADYLTTQLAGFEQISGKYQAAIEIDGHMHVLSATPYADDYGLDWLIVIATPEASLMKPLQSGIHTAAVVSLITLVGALSLGLVMTRWITRPIIQLNDAVRAMKPGNWGTIETYGHFKEVNQLTSSFNLMGQQLRTAFETLEQRVRERTSELFRTNERLKAQINERKRAEEALVFERAQLLSIFDSIDEIIYVIDPETYEILYVNQALRNNFQKELIGGICYREFQNLDAPCEFCTNEIILRQKPAPYRWEFHNPILDRHFAITDRIIKWPDGRDVKFELAIDITRRKRIEEEKLALQCQLQRMEKAESLSRMAGAVAHHFNNMLAVTIGNLDMVKEDLPPGTRLSENVAEAQKAAWHAAEISGLMLTYLGQSRGKPEQLDLSENCRRHFVQLRTDLPEGVRLETDLPSPGPMVKADLLQMRQVLAALVTNAWEAVKDSGGKVQVSVDTVKSSDIPERHRFPAEFEPSADACACLSVTDTGCGIDAATINRVFDPFFTDKFTGRGLGLTVTLGIVKAHDGAITVESEPGRGSTFRVFLPLSDEDIPRIRETAVRPPPAIDSSGAVLLVEDQDGVRNVAKAMLEQIGFEVLVAGDGAEAVEIFRENQENIGLVLSDLNMPRMNGWEALAALRAIRSDIPVILASGYDEAHVMADDHAEQPQAFLHKPYQLATLKETLDRVLRGNRMQGS